MSLSRVAIIMLVPVALVAVGCDGQNVASQSEDVIDQASPDVTVLSADTTEVLHGTANDAFDASKCTKVKGQADLVDCTTAFQTHYHEPAMHGIRLRHDESSFECHRLKVVTASRKAAFDASDGIGFYYKGWLEETRLISKSKLKKIGTTTLSNGEAGVLHEFSGLAVCWLGTASSSSHAKYTFKPFMQFSSPDGEVYRNWDSVKDNYVISSTVTSFDRSKDVVKSK